MCSVVFILWGSVMFKGSSALPLLWKIPLLWEVYLSWLTSKNWLFHSFFARKCLLSTHTHPLPSTWTSQGQGRNCRSILSFDVTHCCDLTVTDFRWRLDQTSLLVVLTRHLFLMSQQSDPDAPQVEPRLCNPSPTLPPSCLWCYCMFLVVLLIEGGMALIMSTRHLVDVAPLQPFTAIWWQMIASWMFLWLPMAWRMSGPGNA